MKNTLIFILCFAIAGILLFGNERRQAPAQVINYFGSQEHTQVVNSSCTHIQQDVRGNKKTSFIQFAALFLDRIKNRKCKKSEIAPNSNQPAQPQLVTHPIR